MAACCGRASCTNCAIREVVRLQEDLGLPSITDGEFRRDLHRHYYAPMTTGMGLITFEE